MFLREPFLKRQRRERLVAVAREAPALARAFATAPLPEPMSWLKIDPADLDAGF